ncbi:Rho termination factor N-terminal domain-containing protein [Lacrimispora sp.]|uniref:Rho termination factor N-terminal domain-containing protein n=1 Tax=Lacrimispora sp. TaxID=2719234 RepID=UPI00289ECD7C|nr:Rho termination factor N-terminal domain-containing protein [Lacrimispora sp.]
MRLIKGNIERIVEDSVKANRLIAEGFKELENVEKVKSETLAEPETPQEPEKKLEDMTVPELKVLAKEKGIEGSSSLNREDLLSVLKDVE